MLSQNITEYHAYYNLIFVKSKNYIYVNAGKMTHNIYTKQFTVIATEELD